MIAITGTPAFFAISAHRTISFVIPEFMSNPLNQDLSRCLSETSTLVLPNEVKGYETVINPFIDEGTLGLSNTDDALDKAQKALEDYIKNNK